MSRASFTPARDGFHFENDFVNRIATIPAFGNVETRGRCGGMAFAALDYYFNGLPIPPERTEDFPGTGVPPDGHPLADYIYARLLESFVTPSSANFISWTLHADHSTWFFKGVHGWTREDEFPRICAAIDEGRPVPIGLVSARNIGDIGQNHQVVAYGYDVDAANDFLILYVYDNNHRDVEATLTVGPGRSPVSESTSETWAWVLPGGLRAAPAVLHAPSSKWLGTALGVVGGDGDQRPWRHAGDRRPACRVRTRHRQRVVAPLAGNPQRRLVCVGVRRCAARRRDQRPGRRPQRPRRSGGLRWRRRQRRLARLARPARRQQWG